ncbi:MAG: exopolysaccharide Pel transporter PelG [Elusimicrobia bacterium]|nr:exopolysaccharide Pel transporter PelG [Elusimicrobiota bacterium]
MAGIGFRLQKLLAEDSYSGSVKAYSLSALISAGPFLLTILAVSLIRLWSMESLTADQQATFQALVTRCFALSLLSVGPSYLVVTRFAADEYYRAHVTSFTAVFFSTVSLHALVFGPLLLIHFSSFALSASLRLSAVLLCLVTGGTWLALIFLSAAKDYARMGLSFLVGGAGSFAFGLALGGRLGLPGYFGGFMLGQALVFAMLSYALVREFGYREPRDMHWLSYFKRQPLLAATGFLYNLGIWADKFLFWRSGQGEAVEAGLRHCPMYDIPIFFAYLTSIPALTFFLVHMETDFFFKYRAYYQGIQNQEGLSALERRRRDIVKSLEASLARLLLVQGLVSAACMLAVPFITSAMRMDPVQMSLLRIGMFAAFLQTGLLIMVNILLYFDLQGEAAVSALVFCALNIVLTRASLSGNSIDPGYGYLLACLGGLAVAFYFLNERLARLHFLTFMRQPLPHAVVIADLDEDEELDPLP